MKPEKYSLTVSSSSKDILEQFHAFMVEFGDQQCLIWDADGERCYESIVKWNIKNRKDLDLILECGYEENI